MKLTEEFLDEYADFYCGSDRITIDATRENGACLTRIDSFFSYYDLDKGISERQRGFLEEDLRELKMCLEYLGILEGEI
ncbi:MAG: hypothetical protein IKE69_11615 [Thermoguttaceae bacterium]|nr:hypothetical protein [Thermoguttaceae bacterium]